MARTGLGEFEMLILTALILLGRKAYGVPIFEELERLTERKRSLSIGSVYTTLDRMEEKGLVTSKFAEATPERGGKAKRYFEITASGHRAVEESAALAMRMVNGLREAGGLA